MTKQQVLSEIITQEMTPQGKVDVLRVLTIAQSRAKQAGLEGQLIFNKADVHRVSSQRRKQLGVLNQDISNRIRKWRSTTSPTATTPAASPTTYSLDQLQAARRLLETCNFDPGQAGQALGLFANLCARS